MLRRSKKKKEKKALQAKIDAQQAKIAGLQGSYVHHPSTVSMSEDIEIENLDQSGSELDGGDTFEESVSLPGTTEFNHQKLVNEGHYHTPIHSLPVSYIPATLTPQTPPSVTSTTSSFIPPSLRRGSSQPTFFIPQTPTHTNSYSLPTMEMPILKEITTTVPTSILQPPRTKVSNGTLPRKQKPKQIVDAAKQKLIDNAVSFGLGRGIDATNKTPWINKNTFQVRRVHSSVIESNEGGILMNYEHEILSISEMEDKFQSSINPPESPVTIHVEDEMDRCVSGTRRLIGRRVVNRSISFQADIEEKYTDGDTPRNGRDSYLVPHDPAEVVSNTQFSGYNFEERVCQWLIQRIAHKYAITNHRLDTRSEENPTDQLAKMLHTKTVSRIEEEIKVGCRDLVQGLRTTHYVTKMQLGATEYRVMSDGEYHKKVAQGGAFGMDTLAIVALDQDMKQTKKEAGKCSQVRKIGVIGEDNKVTKEDEIILVVEVQPITRLIRLPIVKAAISSALEKYMEGTPSSEGETTSKCLYEYIILFFLQVVHLLLNALEKMFISQLIDSTIMKLRVPKSHLKHRYSTSSPQTMVEILLNSILYIMEKTWTQEIVNRVASVDFLKHLSMLEVSVQVPC